MKRFKQRHNKKAKAATLTLDEKFTHDDWPELIAYYKDNIAKGTKDWTVDLRNLAHVSSSSIGTLMAINTSIRGYKGNFKIIVGNDSAVADQIRFSKLDRVVKMEVDFGEDEPDKSEAEAS